MGKNRNHDLPYGVIVTGVQLSGMRLCVTPPGPVEVLGGSVNGYQVLKLGLSLTH